MKPYDLNPDAKSLEEEFFARENRRLLEEIRTKAARDERRRALREVLLTQDEAFIDHLLELEIGPETVLAVALIPLAVVAWADGKLDDRERDAIQRAAEQRNVKPGTPAHELLANWLQRQPGEGLMRTWKAYVRAVLPSLTTEERAAMRDSLIGSARQVAESAGGFLGMSKVSTAERQVLDDLDSVFRDSD